MRAVQFSTYGGPDVLEMVDTEPPHAGPGEIVVEVISAGINQIDAKIRSGAMASTRPTPLPAGTGVDAAGTVVETASRLLAALGLDQGTLLVSGASGGVGTAVIQLAVARGLTVIGTASEKNHAYLAELGAVPISYGPGLSERVKGVAPGGVDGALDISGAGVIGDLIAITGDPSRVITIADPTAESFGARFSRGGARPGGPGAAFSEALSLPRFTLPIDHTFPLEEAGDAHRRAEDGHTVGKLVVIP